MVISEIRAVDMLFCSDFVDQGLGLFISTLGHRFSRKQMVCQVAGRVSSLVLLQFGRIDEWKTKIAVPLTDLNRPRPLADGVIL